MATLPKQILSLIVRSPGLTDREITNALRGVGAPQQPINQAARSLESQGILVRLRRDDGSIGNYVTEKKMPMAPCPDLSSNNSIRVGPRQLFDIVEERPINATFFGLELHF